MGGPNGKCFSFAYGDPRRADVRVLIAVAPADTSTAGSDRQHSSSGGAGGSSDGSCSSGDVAGARVVCEIPAHAILLEEASAWARAALHEHWSSGTARVRPGRAG
jgi:hypothetical protein